MTQMAYEASHDFQTECNGRICDAARGMVKTKFLQASMDSLSAARQSSSECQD